MTPLRIAERLGEDFLAQALHRDYHHQPGAVDASGLLSWDDLNHILATHRLQPPRLRLTRGGETLPALAISAPEVTRRHVVWDRLHPAAFHARLADGASIALDSADELHRPLGEAAEELERVFRTRWQANVYASWTATEGFGCHWDTHDVVVVQIDGAKRWRIYGPTRPYPLHRDTAAPEPPTGEPVADLVLRPGDLLYVPRGWWHSVSADQGVRSLHVTFGAQPHTSTDLLHFVCDQLVAHEAFRADLPLLGPPEEQAAVVAGIGMLVAEQLADPGLIARYRAHQDGQALGRMSPSLPYLDGVPADPRLRVRMTTARAVLTLDDDTAHLAAASHVYEFAPAAGPALQMLVGGGEHTLGELAAAAGVGVNDIAGLVQELVEGQAVAVTGTSR
ncbi:cupin domain-containing protein [Streptomyces sp. NPDC037389]|uniref:cupin domain-containing protein n=1 Tax=Streptomyces sp. NPDC037389 TaxID=3155369 RepID=UPI0033EFC2D0